VKLRRPVWVSCLLLQLWLAGSVPAFSGSLVLRVLIERSSSTVELGQPGRLYRVMGAPKVTSVRGPLQVAARARQQWQIGAFGNTEEARRAAQQVLRTLGRDVTVSVSERPGSDLTRVRVCWEGTPPNRPEKVLSALGFGDAYAVDGDGVIEITSESGTQRCQVAQLDLLPQGDWPTAVGDARYRGSFTLRAHGNELLVINRVELEQYLQSVLPSEMAPTTFPELEALKAQAVAARTYAIAHRGDGAAQGYDLCATAACQVYLGVAAEHPLTTRAVRETEGVVITYNGTLIDALYTSTCGGHTQSSHEIFAGQPTPYLQGVACSWERPLQLRGRERVSRVVSREQLEQELAAVVVGAGPAAPATPQLLRLLARRCGTLAGVETPAANAQEYASQVMRAAGLEEAGAALTGRTAALERLLVLADMYGAPLALPPTDWGDGWHLRAVFAALRILGIIGHDSGDAVPLAVGPGFYPEDGLRARPLTSPTAVYERWASSLQEKPSTEVLPGTALEVYREDDRVLAVVVVRSGGNGEADRRSAWRSWVRELSLAEVARRLRTPELAELRVAERTPTGRVSILVGRLRSGDTRSWSAAVVKRMLELPETRFSLHLVSSQATGTTVRFLGRGWGHGVGLCQNGAYGLARAGKQYVEILTTYYTGVQVGQYSASTP